MSKSLGNYITIEDEPKEMYGKVMSIPDKLILDYFELLTDVPDEELSEFRQGLATGSVNPMELKKRLAYELVAQFHSIEAARDAERHFVRVFQMREAPEEIREYALSSERFGEGATVSGLLSKAGLTSSRSEARRLIAQGAVEVDGEKVTEDVMILFRDGIVIKVGKHRFLRLVNADEKDVPQDSNR
jgi:tyrosyl-tRNA synthetase